MSVYKLSKSKQSDNQKLIFLASDSRIFGFFGPCKEVYITKPNYCLLSDENVRSWQMEDCFLDRIQ